MLQPTITIGYQLWDLSRQAGSQADVATTSAQALMASATLIVTSTSFLKRCSVTFQTFNAKCQQHWKQWKQIQQGKNIKKQFATVAVFIYATNLLQHPKWKKFKHNAISCSTITNYKFDTVLEDSDPDIMWRVHLWFFFLIY